MSREKPLDGQEVKVFFGVRDVMLEGSHIASGNRVEGMKKIIHPDGGRGGFFHTFVGGYRISMVSGSGRDASFWCDKKLVCETTTNNRFAHIISCC
jgi:hypothetical protein